MSDNYDIIMNLDETVELDTIIEQSSKANKPVNVKPSESDYNLKGIRKYMSVFNPQEARDYTIDVNGQEIHIKVEGSGLIIDNYEESLYENNSKTISDYYDGQTNQFERQQTTVYSGKYALKNTVSGGSSSTITSKTGLNNYPSKGDTISVPVRWNKGIFHIVYLSLDIKTTVIITRSN